MMVNLRIPGPTPCPEDILLAGAQQMINHRGPEFAELIDRVHSRLQNIYNTANDIIILTASGTGALEAAVVNTISPGDRVLGISIGVFGDRFCQLVQAYGGDLVKPEIPLGAAADPDLIKKALKDDPTIKVVAVTHNETSTGITNDLQAIARIVRDHEKLLLVDAISSLGCIPLESDAWGCDVVTTASQKGFMVPPGLAFASVNERGWSAAKEATTPRFYFDFGRHLTYFKRGQTPWTPAVSVLFSLDLALEQMLAEGMESIHTRQAIIGRKTREGIKALGLKLFAADETYASNTVTAVHVPEAVDAGKLLGLLRTEYNTVLAGGQGPAMEGKVFRIGHMGYVSEQDIDGVLETLGEALPQVGFTA
jgi:aspartate aminotransferase-like enzyme